MTKLVFMHVIYLQCVLFSPQIFTVLKKQSRNDKRKEFQLQPPPPGARAADKQCKFYSTKKKKMSSKLSNYTRCIQLGTNTIKYTNYKHPSKHKLRKENDFLQLKSILITFYRGKEFQLYLPTLLQSETLGWFYLLLKKKEKRTNYGLESIMPFWKSWYNLMGNVSDL